MAFEETENSLENKLTITFPSIQVIKSISNELLAPQIYSNSLTKLYVLKLSNHKTFCLTHLLLTACLPAHANQPTA